MAIANGSRHRLAYILEVTPGVTPATPAFKRVRHNSSNLALTKQAFQSQELRDDRQIADLRHGTYQVGGNFVSELSYGTLDDFLEAAMCGTWASNILKAGVTRRAFTFERTYLDIAKFIRYKGVEFNGFSFGIQPNGMITMTFPLVGLTSVTDSAIIAGATYGAPTTTSPMDGFSGDIEEGGVSISLLSEVQMQIDNGLVPLFVIGQQGAVELSIGRSNITGNATAYFSGLTLLDKFINETDSTMSFTVSDVAGNTYEFLMDRIKYTGGSPDVQSEGPVTLAMPFQALLASGGSLTNLQITRTPA